MYKKTLLISAMLAVLGCESSRTHVADTALTTEHQYQSHHYLRHEASVSALIEALTLEEKARLMYDKSAAVPRLGIPEYNYWNESLHGVARAGEATVFPQAIGLAASFDENLMFNVASVISTEGRAKHNAFIANDTRSMYTGLNYWSPNINIFRDPRWGRGQETYGEDPVLTSKMAVQFLNGLQGDDESHLKTIGTVKHYAVHSGPEPSRHSDNFDPTPHDLNATYLDVFARVFEATDVHSLMCAYNAVDGDPACINEQLMQTKLREEYDFKGFVVSDCGAVADIFKETAHHHTPNYVKAIARSIEMGVDLECGDGDGSYYIKGVVEAVEKGWLSEQAVDTSVRRLLSARFALGLLGDEPTVFDHLNLSSVGTQEHLALAEDAAVKAHVLLKNDGLLPLTLGQRVVVIGPNADNPDVLTANYHGRPVNPVTPLQGLQAMQPVDFAQGAYLAAGVPGTSSLVPSSHYQDLTIRYYVGTKTDEAPVAQESVASIDQHWRKAPTTGVDDANWTAEYQGYFVPEASGTYEFFTSVQLMLDGKPVKGEVSLKKGHRYALQGRFVNQETWHSNAIGASAQLRWVRTDIDLQQQAVDLAKTADVIVFVGGLSARLEGEEMDVHVPGFLGGDRTHIDLPKEQLELFDALTELGKPLVAINYSGSAVNLAPLKQHANALVQGFYPGEATGTALAKMLYGERSPAGKLPITFYSSVDQLPAFDDYDMLGRTHRYFQGEPQYRFGYGLSYGQLSEPEFRLVKSTPADGVVVDVTATNHGELMASEVWQVYLEPQAENALELQQLKTFKAVDIAPGETLTTRLTIPYDEFTFFDASGEKQSLHQHAVLRLGEAPDASAPRVTVTFTE